MQARPEHDLPIGTPEESGAPFAGRAEHAECRRLHKRYGTTYYFATRTFPAPLRRRVHALYGFVRVPDEWVDNGGDAPPGLMRRRLHDFRSQLIRGVDGVRPEHPVLRAFVDVMRETRMPLDEPLLFLDAMEADLDVARYADYPALVGYMRGSAAAVGLMMLDVTESRADEPTREAAIALGEAMQLTNFLRDVGEDRRCRERVYMPQDELARFGLSNAVLADERVTPEWSAFSEFQIARARALYARADEGLPALPSHVRRPVTLARVLYSRILDRIEERGHDVFTGRARTSTPEKLRVLAQVGLGLGR